MTQVWETLIQKRDYKIIQSNYVLPLENIFGNFETKISSSLYSVTSLINHSINEFAKNYKNVFVLDIDRLASSIGRQNWFNETLWFHSKTISSLEWIPFLAQNIIDIYLAINGSVIKCIVLDLDNTLWGGVIGDDGLGGIALGHLGEGEAYYEFQQYLLELKKRGIILTVCSKNEIDNAILPFKEHPEMVLKEQDITIFVANWNNKAENIKYIKNSLNIGFDSIVFLDDNPFERNLVREYLPDVIVPELPEDPAEYVRYISKLNLFETTSLTDEDKSRAEMYKIEFQRKELEKNFTDVNEYLKSLNMKIAVKKFHSFYLPRIAQLIQRSNQFNLTTKRYTELECETLMNSNQYIPLFAKLSDKFGDYGLISVVIFKHEGNEIYIDTWLMSCRVLARGVEQFIMNYIFDFAKENNCKIVRGEYIPTTKNTMVKDFFGKFGFNRQDGEDGKIYWHLNTEDYKYQKVFLEESFDE